jgi:hypothetical protein
MVADDVNDHVCHERSRPETPALGRWNASQNAVENERAGELDEVEKVLSLVL